MTGWRIGYVTAPKFMISEMEKLMGHMDSGVTTISQQAAFAATQGPQDCVGEMLAEYKRRRKVLYEGLREIDGINCMLPEGTFYAFTNISALNKSSLEFATYLLRQHKVAVVPGRVFGKNGKGIFASLSL